MKDKNDKSKNTVSLAEIFSRRIIDLRKEKQMSQYELAEAIGFPRTKIAYYESRAQNPTLEIVEKFASFFEVSPTSLIMEPSKDSNKVNGQISKMENILKKMKNLSLHKQRMITNAVEAMINSN